MNPKTTIGLVVALAIAMAGVWWAQRQPTSKTIASDVGPKSLFDIGVGDITGFEVKSGAASACSFIKKDGQWQMTSPIKGHAQQGFVSGDVSIIANLKYTKAFDKADPDRPTDQMTSLDRPLRIVKLTDKDEKAHILKIGARQKLSTKTYVQKQGDQTIYLVNADLNTSLHRSLSDYRGKRVTQFKTPQAVRVEVRGEQNYTLVKKDGKWTVETPIKARADQSKVRALLQGVANLTVSDFVDDQPKTLRPYGLDNPRLAVAVITENKTPKPVEGPPASQPAEPQYDITTHTVGVAFGGTAEKKVFAKLDNPDSPAVFQVAEDILKKVGPELKDLRDKKIANIQTKRAQRIKLTSRGDSVELVKQGTDWRIASGVEGGVSDVAEFAAVDDFLKAVGDLKAVGFEDEALPSFGFDTPKAAIEIFAEGRVQPVRLLVGNLAPSKTSVYIKNQGENFVAAVAADAAEGLMARPFTFLSREIQKFDRARASSLEIVRSDATRTVQRSGAAWRFASPVQGPAETTAVNNILSDLSNLRGRRVVARAADAASFGLDRPAVKVTATVQPPPKPGPTTQPATDSQPTEPKAPPTFHTVLVSRHDGKVYAMPPGGATICEVDGKVLDDLEAELLDTRVLSLVPSQVRRLTYSGETSFTFEKQGDDWTLQNEASFPTDPAKITQLAEALRDLRAKRFVRYLAADPAQYGLDKPQTVIGIDTEGGQTVSLRISARGPSGADRYALVSTQDDRVFVIKTEDLTKLQKQPKDFRKAG